VRPPSSTYELAINRMSPSEVHAPSSCSVARPTASYVLTSPRTVSRVERGFAADLAEITEVSRATYSRNTIFTAPSSFFWNMS
jgi:hypothetical protein